MDFPDIFTWQIMKWVLIVLAAGFIGQFGKSFAQHVMNRVKRKKAETAAALPSPAEVPSPQGQIKPADAWTSGPVSNKKETKALLKARKKEAKQKGLDE
jgi:hypothetical protein